MYAKQVNVLCEILLFSYINFRKLLEGIDLHNQSRKTTFDFHVKFSMKCLFIFW